MQENNANVGGGQIIASGQALLVHGIGRVSNLDQVGNIVVIAHAGAPVRIRDVAEVRIGHELRRGAASYQGQGEVVMGLGFMLMGENSREVTTAQKARLDTVRKALPEDVVLETVYDRTELVDQVIATVEHNLVAGAILVIAILFLLLGNVRAGLLVAAAIPLSMLFAETCYIYVRGEYPHSIGALEDALLEARKAGLVGRDIMGSGFSCDIWVHAGAGAYICGEETALLTSLEGNRGYPRLRPPFPAVEGLWHCPTVVNNVETLACVSHILRRGASWFSSLGCEGSTGTWLFCISGHVKNPGVYELPIDVHLMRLIEEHAGGMRPGRRLKAVIPGGVSAPSCSQAWAGSGASACMTA